MESKILLTMLIDRDSYELISDSIEDNDLSDQGRIIYDYIEDYYSNDPEAVCVDVDLIRHRIEREYPKHKEVLLSSLNNIENTSPANIQREWFELKKQRVEQDLAHALMAGDSSSIEALLERYEKYQQGVCSASDDDGSVYIGEPLETLLDTVHPDNLIKVYPRILNERLGGGVPPGTHILVYARPEAGKTAFAINMACGFARQNKTVLYIGNEEPYNMMLLRIISRLTGMRRDQIMENPEAAMERALERGYENIIFVSLSPGTMDDVRRLAKKYEPDVILVDQLHNLSSKEKNKVERLEEQAKDIRDLGHSSGAVCVSLTQAAESAENKAVLDMGDVYYSNTGIQGHVDIMLGIGMDNSLEEYDRRIVSMCKNKWSGDHTPFKIQIDRFLSKVTSL